MGDLSDPDNTFWELFHAAPGSPHWSLVTPPGRGRQRRPRRVSVRRRRLVGVVPSQLLRFSPLAESTHGGSSWVPAFLPGALAPVPDALGLRRSVPGGAIALVEQAAAHCARRSASRPGPHWSRPPRCSRVSPGCGVDGLDGAALLPDRGTTDRHRLPARRAVGLFTRTAATWRQRRAHAGRPAARSSHHRAPGAVDGSDDDRARVAEPGGRRALVALWQSGDAPWTVPGRWLSVRGRPSGPRAVNSAGDVAVLLGGPEARVTAVDVVARQEHGTGCPASPRGPRRWRCPPAHLLRADRISMPSRWTGVRSASSR